MHALNSPSYMLICHYWAEPCIRVTGIHGLTNTFTLAFRLKFAYLLGKVVLPVLQLRTYYLTRYFYPQVAILKLSWIFD